MDCMTKASTGMKSLDQVVDYLRLGDNVVWQVDAIDDYKYFVNLFVENALISNRRVVYMRFAQHPPLIEGIEDITVCALNACGGFESFSTQVYDIISREGKEVYYVFDCLSDLLTAWANDLMIGNFFMITCPYLFELDTIAYFTILRNKHSFQTVARIRETTQLLIDLYNCEDCYYIHPLKVWDRYSPTMFLPHALDRENLTPITNSVDAARLFTIMPTIGIENERRHLDYWDKMFLNAVALYKEVLEGKETAAMEQKKVIEQLCKLVIGRDHRILSLAKKYLSLKDLLDIKSRLIGSGYIGGKAVGMLMARSILLKDKDFEWRRYLEPHDSYYIGSDVFYSYIVQNGWWKLRMKQRSNEGYFQVASELREKMLKGSFPAAVKEQFQQMLEYFGQSPIIVRSSSLLEDAFGNAFAGKYESVFCVNQGSPAERYKQFEDAIRVVYASAMNEDALAYRLQRGLDKRDEQMAILVQRVSGAHHGQYFFPDLAGVGVSYNTYVWKEGLNPDAGMLRLVHGLGTRAVDRVEGDYPRIVALDKPLLRPHAGVDDSRKYSQREVDVLNTVSNKLEVVSLNNMDYEGREGLMNLIGVKDYEANRRMKELGMKGPDIWTLTFDHLMTATSFPQIMGKMLKTIKSAYQYPVDIEFTINFSRDLHPHINLLQCRPLQTKGLKSKVHIPSNIREEKVLFKSKGHFMGGNISQSLKRIIYIDPKNYSKLALSQKYEVARTVGKLNKQIQNRENLSVMLAGPGRWGTSNPSLGVPVAFSEINHVTVMIEIAFSSAGLIPELSFGTHFFQDLVETDIFYVALFPEKNNVFFNHLLMNDHPNIFNQLCPDKLQFEEIIKVYDFTNKDLVIMSDILSQNVVCFLEEK
ncbi:PEP/pyruvate-binding domain-containing protein [Clostridium formicaceticum]|uniref:Phosphoenolpyruvate synthase n=1 Tax=Clostridium formicaceticum TaxID=1497 RepID=A0AAC9RPG3_9CLOT|nr:PEP/pyruvate-binding domain-containing protein [Clostridium formicaceticum]AOY75287.1 phosphoenolpyruvate synthase [Clostridium formicaceticum]ARE89726.1 phosphoenolpyruvate synthase [Clostridium formicaceticum]